MFLISNDKSADLADGVSKILGIKKGDVEKKVFPDGEIYVRILSEIADQSFAVVHTTQTNDDLIELILTLSALSGGGAKNIVCVIPHMIYQRQDSAFFPGEAVSAEVVVRMIEEYCDEILLVNAHFLERGGVFEFAGTKIRNLDAFPLLGGYFSDVKNLVIVSPDEGSMHYAKAAADAVGCPYDHLVKTRLDGETVEMSPKDLDVGGKNIVILDDIISTGGTMKTAAQRLLDQGAKKVVLGCVHGVFTKGFDVFEGYDVVCTDSLPTPLSKISLAPVISEALEDYLK